jgi:hypothetical protein
MLGLALHGWENAMVVFLIIAGFFALVAGVATWAVVRLQRLEIVKSEQEFEKYKLDTRKEISDANARQKEAELKLAQLRKLAGPREINFDRLKEELEGKPKAPVAIWYVPEVSDGYWFASRLFSGLHMAGWEASWPQTIPELTKEDIDRVMPDPSGRLYAILHGQPPAMNAGGQPSGITVVGDSDIGAFEPNAPMTAHKALFQALAKSTDFGMAGGFSQFMPVPKGTLRVVVAAKADPIFDRGPVAAQPTNPK